jgi:hypothetical protein
MAIDTAISVCLGFAMSLRIRALLVHMTSIQVGVHRPGVACKSILTFAAYRAKRKQASQPAVGWHPSHSTS